MIKLRDHGGIFSGSGNKALNDIFKNVPNKKLTPVVLGTINNARNNTGSFNGAGKRIEGNVSIRETQPWETTPTVYPYLYVMQYDNHIDANISQYSRQMTDHGGNSPGYGDEMGAFPIGINKDWYFWRIVAGWNSANRKTSRGIYNCKTGVWRSWNTLTNEYFVASDISGNYYKFNSSTNMLSKVKVSDDSVIWSSTVAVGIIPTTDHRIFAENTKYLYVTTNINNTWSNSMSSVNVTLNIFRIDKTTGSVVNFLPSINSVGSHFRMFATETQLIIYKGNYPVVVNNEPLYIYDTDTGILLTTTTAINSSVPIMYYADKGYMLCRKFWSNSSSPTYTKLSFILFDIASNTQIASSNMFEMDHNYGGQGYEGYLFQNEGFVQTWEHTKRYLANKKEYFSTVGAMHQSTVPYFMYDFIIK